MNEETRNRIISAAGGRFAHYGYGKTTMVEIAKDCDMSVGNLYRFYKNKEAIAVAGAECCFREKAESSEAAVQSNSSVFEQLYGYLNTRLGYMHRFVSETPHMNEMVELISTCHKELLQSYEERAIQYMAGIIREGQSNGTVKPGDAEGMAADLYRATMCFNIPLCMYGPLDEKEVQLKSLLKTVYRGLGSQ